jgi:carboxyl-terminal processing protease
MRKSKWMFSNKACAGKSVKAGLISFILLLTAAVWFGPRTLVQAGQTAISKMVLFTMVLEKIDRFYVTETNTNQLVDRAIHNMVAELDPHSSYLSAEEFSAWKRTSQAYHGVGLNYRIQSDRLLITSVHPQGPAAEAGINAGDAIIRLEGKKVEYLTAEDLDKILQDDSRSTVKLLLERNGAHEQQSVELTKRPLIPSSLVAAFMIGDSTGYIHLSRFSQSTPAELDAAMNKLQRLSMHQLLLDLRDNSGGLFTAAVEIADRFLSSGRMIVYTTGRSADASLQYTATNGKKYPVQPLIVLVNEASASDSEILAGALQDWDRGLIIGRPTFGKGSVQTEYSFQDGSGLLLTTAVYFTPLGRSIQKNPHGENKSLRTPKGRMVQTGGGIFPDFDVQADQQPVSDALKKALTAVDNPLLKFIEKQPPSTFHDPMTFCKQFQVSETLLQSFYDAMKRSGHSFSSRERQQSNQHVRFILKREMAGRFWGEDGRIMATVYADHQVLKSLPYFRTARALITQ